MARLNKKERELSRPGKQTKTGAPPIKMVISAQVRVSFVDPILVVICTNYHWFPHSHRGRDSPESWAR